MTFGYQLRVRLAPGERFSSEHSTIELDLPPPIGNVLLHPVEGGRFAEVGRLVFTAGGFETREYAEAAGRALKDVVRLAGLQVGRAIDVGDDRVQSGAGQSVREAAAAEGIKLLPDVHGLLVFEETGTPRVVSVRAEAEILRPLSDLTDAAASLARTSRSLTEREALAIDLMSLAVFESSLRAKHVMTVIAGEVLADRQQRTGTSAELVERFIAATEAALQAATPEEQPTLRSLKSALEVLRSESIGAALRRSVAAIDDSPEANAVIGDSYRARSSLLHDGTTSQDLATLKPKLRGLLARLVLDAVGYTANEEPAQ